MIYSQAPGAGFLFFVEEPFEWMEGHESAEQSRLRKRYRSEPSSKQAICHTKREDGYTVLIFLLVGVMGGVVSERIKRDVDVVVVLLIIHPLNHTQKPSWRKNNLETVERQLQIRGKVGRSHTVPLPPL